jgi:hypothetical protein
MSDDIPVEEEAAAAEEAVAAEEGAVGAGHPRRQAASHHEWELGQIVIVLLFAVPVIACVLFVIFLTVVT